MPMFFKGANDSEIVTVTFSVGFAEAGTRLPAVNYIPDMELVDYLLYRVYQSNFFPNSRKVFLEIENAGRKTGMNLAQYKLWLPKYILKFQNDRNKKIPHPRVFPDGRIDPILRGTGVHLSSITNTQYTILALQSILLTVSGKKSIKDFMEFDGVLKGQYPHAYSDLFSID